MKNAVALGTFDGVHIGHRAVLDLPEEMHKIAVVFRDPPKAAINGAKASIMTYDYKCEVLKSIGINEVVPLDFTAVKDISAEDFLIFLEKEFSPSVISCGFNYKFGKNAAGNTEMLKNFCRENDVEFQCSEAVTAGDITVSSTVIRNYLCNGEIEKADALMTADFSFTADVINGDKRGRTIGFPTINQKYPEELVPLKFGVYKTSVCFDGKEYSGITNIGIRPTYHSDFVISETYIIDFSGDIYGKSVRIVPRRFLRGEVRFSSLEALKEQIAADIKS